MILSPLKSALAGGCIWLITVAWLHPSPMHLQWAAALLLLAPLALVAPGLAVALQYGEAPAQLQRWAVALQLPSALLLLAAFAVSPGWLAAVLSLPWLAVTAMIALSGALRLLKRGGGPVAEMCLDAGLIYLAVGGMWVMLSRFGARPLNFDPVIVLLTAIHFHYAGFVLPLMTGLAARHTKSALSRAAACGVIAGVPLTALGITTTQLGFGHLFESLAAVLTAAAGMLTAWLHFRLARQSEYSRLARVLWSVAACSLVFGMMLAVCYGLRFYIPAAWPDIAWMRALHGSANALGTGLCGLFAWSAAQEQRGRQAEGA
ncbi:MAG TPA: YndJ family protein [Blastocatellia bacterium]|nr:YndJ family protein [Blastocatellia bacterium]